MNAFEVNTKFSVTLMGALLLFLGVAILAHAGRVTVFVVQLTGFACAAYGIVSIASRLLYAHTKDAVPFEELALSGVLLLAGAMVALNPQAFAKVLFSLLGVLIVISGLGDIARSRDKSALQEGEEKLALRIGIATVAAGAFVALVPSAAMRAAPIVCGILLIIDGVSELYLALRME